MKISEYSTLLPADPYCGNISRECRPRPADDAVRYPVIQHNAPGLLKWMVFDLDVAGAWFLPEERGLPTPTYTAINPRNGHAHIGYRLDAPVSLYAKSREGPRRFYEDVQRGFTRRLGADPCYGGFLTKNPVHPHWIVDWQAGIPWRLDELNDSLDFKDKRWTPREIERSGLSRNCDTFDVVREFAYKAVLRFKKEKRSESEFLEWLYDFTLSEGKKFRDPLSRSECRAISVSISRYCWEKFTLEKFSAVQAFRVNLRWAKEGPVDRSPWISMGISRRTYYRKKNAYPDMV